MSWSFIAHLRVGASRVVRSEGLLRESCWYAWGIYLYLRPQSAASIWFEIWGSWIRVNEILIFLGKFPRNFDFFSQFKKSRFARQNLPIHSYFWASYSTCISLQKSPLSNIGYFLYMTRYNNISRLDHHPHHPLPKIWESRPP